MDIPHHLFIVSRDHHDLYIYLCERFAGDPKVKVILDRRWGERELAKGVILRDCPERNRRHRPEIDKELRSGSHVILTVE
jgi:hypothetical protein